MDDDAKWFRLIHDFYQHFAYQDITTQQVVDWWNQNTGLNLTPFFDQYLRHVDIPALELKFEPGKVSYRWKAGETNFAMPVKVGDPAHWTLIHPTTAWQTLDTSLPKETFQVATELYYINVEDLDDAAAPKVSGY